MEDPRRWKIEDDDAFAGQDLQDGQPKRKLFGSPVRFLFEVGFLLLIAFGIWQVWLFQSQQSDSTLVNLVQGVLDLEHEALLDGNGELFMSLQSVDPAWQSAQLRPENQAVIRAGPEVSFAEEFENIIWARVNWVADGEKLTRVAFFENREGRLLHSPNSPSNFWGSEWQDQYSWGLLIYHGVDEKWADDIGQFVSDTISDVCSVACLETRINFNLILATDYEDTAAHRNIRVPSAQLIALDEKGNPASAYWDLLEQTITQYISPATIKFAVFPNITPPRNPIYDYEEFAEDFMEDNPGIRVELTEFNETPEDFFALANEFDGAGIQPNENLLASGLVRDLTAYMYTDPSFGRADFYEQVIRGSEWRSRYWSVPFAASMPLIFYDRDAFVLSGLNEPTSDWTWEEMNQYIETIVDSANQEGLDIKWGFLDINLDVLYSYAFHWDLFCNERAVILCHNPLLPPKVAAALDWYQGYSGESKRIPAISDITADWPIDLLLNFQGAKRQAAIWVDIPINYENQILLKPVGVVAFPGSKEIPGVTPLSVYGGFISQNSENPLAVWEWLKYMSYQLPSGRLIPARPSVADSSGYWTTLPSALSGPMIHAFPFTQPISAENMASLSWRQVTSVVVGESSPLEAAMDRPPVEWFGGIK